MTGLGLDTQAKPSGSSVPEGAAELIGPLGDDCVTEEPDSDFPGRYTEADLYGGLLAPDPDKKRAYEEMIREGRAAYQEINEACPLL